MRADGVVGVRRRRSRTEGERLVYEFEQSGLGRKEFCTSRGLSVHTLDGWRRRIAESGSSGEKIVPVEIVDRREAGWRSTRPASAGHGGQFRVVLGEGLRVEVEVGFDGAELRRLIAALDRVGSRGV